MSLTNAIATLKRHDAKVKVDVPASGNHKAYSYYREGSGKVGEDLDGAAVEDHIHGWHNHPQARQYYNETINGGGDDGDGSFYKVGNSEWDKIKKDEQEKHESRLKKYYGYVPTPEQHEELDKQKSKKIDRNMKIYKNVLLASAAGIGLAGVGMAAHSLHRSTKDSPSRTDSQAKVNAPASGHHKASNTKPPKGDSSDMSLTNAIAILKRQDAKTRVDVPASNGRKAYSYYKEGAVKAAAITAGIGGVIAGGALTAGILAMRKAKSGDDAVDPKGLLKGSDAIDAESREVSNAIAGSRMKSALPKGRSRTGRSGRALVTPPPMNSSNRVLVTPTPKSISQMVKEGANTSTASKQIAQLVNEESDLPKRQGIIDKGIEAVKKIAKKRSNKKAPTAAEKRATQKKLNNL
jgi:hypothetical protein